MIQQVQNNLYTQFPQHLAQTSGVHHMPPGVWRLATDGSSRPAAQKPPRAVDGVWRLAVVANFLNATVYIQYIQFYTEQSVKHNLIECEYN